jgi:hypothetical protein
MKLSFDARAAQRLVARALAAAFILSASAMARADAGDADADADAQAPSPPRAQPAPKRRTGLIVAGATTYGSAWLSSVVVGYFGFELSNFTLWGNPPPKDATWLALWVPVAGPFIEVGFRRPSPLATAALVLDGFTQATGLALLVAGLTGRDADPGEARSATVEGAKRPGVRMIPVPLVMGSNGAGLAVAGTF